MSIEGIRLTSFQWSIGGLVVVVVEYVDDSAYEGNGSGEDCENGFAVHKFTSFQRVRGLSSRELSGRGKFF